MEYVSFLVVLVVVSAVVAFSVHYYTKKSLGKSAFDLDKDGDVDVDDAKVAATMVKYKMEELKSKTKAQLIELAKKENLVIRVRDTKAKILEAFESIAD
jgi:hypothetical protein